MKFAALALLTVPLWAQESPLASGRASAFIGSSDSKRTIAFYRDSLGLKLVSNGRIALTFDANNGVRLRIQLVPKVGVPSYTVLGWEVPDVAATAKKLQAAGVEMLRVPGIKQDDAGVWTAPDGTHVAWFKDPDGHTLSIDDSSSMKR